MDDEPIKKGFWHNPLIWLIIIVILAYLVFAGIGWYYQFRSADEFSRAAQLKWLADNNRVLDSSKIAEQERFLKQSIPKSELSVAERLAELAKLQNVK